MRALLCFLRLIAGRRRGGLCLQNKRKSLRVQLARADIIHSQREIEVLFSTLKNSPFPLAQSIKLHVRALVLIPCHRCEKSSWESRNSHHLITQRNNIHTRPTTCAWIRADICRQDGAICSKNRKIVPYYRCARISRLTVSVPDYGSWLDTLCGHNMGHTRFILYKNMFYKNFTITAEILARSLAIFYYQWADRHMNL